MKKKLLFFAIFALVSILCFSAIPSAQNSSIILGICDHSTEEPCIAKCPKCGTVHAPMVEGATGFGTLTKGICINCKYYFETKKYEQ